MTDAPSRRALIRGALAVFPFLAAARAGAQPQPCRPPETPSEKQHREDFPWLARYADDNARLLAARQPVDIVFMGDSITEGWQRRHPAFFTPGRVCRGISGQTTPQMVLRMMQDVIALKPKAVHIMAGTNDIAGNTGPMTQQASQNNFRAMAMLAKSAGIRVVLASIPPADHFPWRQGVAPAEPIRALNHWLQGYARETGAVWIDYTPVLATPGGAMREGLATDGVHPTEAGYDAMEKVLNPVLARIEGRLLRARRG